MFRLKGPQYDIVAFTRHQGEVTRPMLASRLGLSLPTVSLAVKPLLREGILLQNGFRDSSGGRRAEVLRINAQYLTAIGICVTSVGISGAHASLGGQALTSRRHLWSSQPTREEVLQGITKTVAELAQTARKPAGIGVGIAGSVESAEGISRIFPRVQDWRDVPIGALLGKRFKLPVLVDNDVKASALAELRYGVGREAADFIYCFISNGIGCAIVINGRVHRGVSGNAGEIGHIAVDGSGPAACHCGGTCCLETIASPEAVVRRVHEAVKAGTAFTGRAGGDGRYTVMSVINAAVRGDKLACELLDEALARLAHALANAATLLDPRLVVLGGMFTELPARQIDTVKRVFTAKVFRAIARNVDIRVSALGEASGALGAADMVFENCIRGLVAQ